MTDAAGVSRDAIHGTRLLNVKFEGRVALYPEPDAGSVAFMMFFRGIKSGGLMWRGVMIRRGLLEPAVGIEPTTRSLQNCCSAAELSRL